MMRPHAVRRAPTVGALAFAVCTATACAAQLVNGHGGSLPDVRTSPVVVSIAPSFPVSGLPSVPLTSGPESVAPPPRTNGPAPDGDGVLVTSEAGHFQVRMPGTPQRTSEPWSFGGYDFVVHLAIVTAPYVAMVEGEDVTPALGAKSFDLVLRSAVSGIESSSGLKVSRQSETTFQGHQARRAVFEREAVRYDFLAFVYSGSRIYALSRRQGRGSARSRPPSNRSPEPARGVRQRAAASTAGTGRPGGVNAAIRVAATSRPASSRASRPAA